MKFVDTVFYLAISKIYLFPVNIIFPYFQLPFRFSVYLKNGRGFPTGRPDSIGKTISYW